MPGGLNKPGSGTIQGGRAPANAREQLAYEAAVQALQRMQQGNSNPDLRFYAEPKRLPGGGIEYGEQAVRNGQGQVIGYQPQITSPPGTIGSNGEIRGGLPSGVSEYDFREVMGLSTGSQPLTEQQREGVVNALERAGISVPERAEGGITKRGHLAVIGEAGPEVIAPLSRLQDMMRGWAASMAGSFAGLGASAFDRMPALAGAGGSGGLPMTLIVEMDGRAVARASVPYLHGELYRVGVR